ncbi:MAG: serine--tRNA ligase [Candidatus Odinarchaeota archaeon]|nr:serine--tRNA ligase [Candidatus Odinarchaeota archaeon]
MWSILYYVRENPEKIRWSQRRRGLDDSIVDEAIKYDKLWREELTKYNKLRHEQKKYSSKIANAKGDEKKLLIKEVKELAKKIEETERRVKDYLSKRDETLREIPNIVHESVPVGVDENDNVPIKFYGKAKVWSGFLESFLEQVKGLDAEYEECDERPMSHVIVSEKMNLVDTDRAAKVAGSRFYYLLGDLVWIDIALVIFAVNHMAKKGFIPLEPPLMMGREPYSGVTSIEDFKDSLYKIDGEDLYLIATSEHPIAAQFMNEVLEKDELPMKFVGVSPCFRKEAGAHGLDTKGIFRVHQFNKVEQFVFCLPDESWDWHEKMLQYAEEAWQALGLPYRVVNICTGDLGKVAAKKYDIEVWMPAQGKFREVVSCSNCTDYQSARLNIRYAKKRGHPTEGFIHTLNSTVIATSRAITAILENYQDGDGRVRIPDAINNILKNFEGAPHDYIRPLERP